jgi:hypothetical protein
MDSLLFGLVGIFKGAVLRMNSGNFDLLELGREYLAEQADSRSEPDRGCPVQFQFKKLFKSRNRSLSAYTVLFTVYELYLPMSSLLQNG